MQKINENLSAYLNTFYQIEWLQPIVSLFSDLPIFVLPIFLTSMWFYYAYKKNNEWKKKLLTLFFWVVIAIIISYIVKNIHHVERPMMSLENAWNLVLSKIPDASFPSDHAWVSIAFLTWLFLMWYKKFGLILLPFFVLMNLSRIVWWVHWPFDILAWTINWIISAFIIYKLSKLDIFKKVYDFIIKIASYFKL